MTDDASPRLDLPYLAPGQTHKHLTLNDAFAALDGLVQAAVVSRSVQAEPAAPEPGDVYVLPDGRTGLAWSLFDAGDLVRFEGGTWERLAAGEGAFVYVRDEGRFVARGPDGWTRLEDFLQALQNLSRLGVGTAADADNPFAARLPKALFAAPGGAEGGHLRITFNKEAAADVLSLLFQSGWSGRAEVGLIGDDDLTLKVSADGATWSEVLRVDRATGRAAFTRSPQREELTVFTASGVYDVPAWARRVRVVCIGAGGGGGSGASGTSAGNRFGGGGGGAGGRAEEVFDVADLPAALAVTVGLGGAGGASVNAASSVVSGLVGTAGGDSFVEAAGVILVLGGGGAGGPPGTNAAQTPAAGGLGLSTGNPGGVSIVTANPAAAEGLTRGDAPGGGGAGGGVDTSGAARLGARGAHGDLIGGDDRRAEPGAGGALATGGGAGAAKAWTRGCGAGGGGGGGATVSAAGAGGAGGAPGGGGGGGGATRHTYDSGAGGAGARGEVRITAIG